MEAGQKKADLQSVGGEVTPGAAGDSAQVFVGENGQTGMVKGPEAATVSADSTSVMFKEGI